MTDTPTSPENGAGLMGLDPGVTQADREAANRAVRLAKRRLARMAGLDSLDPAFFYKAFARHRLAASPITADDAVAKERERLWEFYSAVDDMTCVWAGTDRPSSFIPRDSDDCDDDEDRDRWERFVAARAAIRSSETATDAAKREGGA